MLSVIATSITSISEGKEPEDFSCTSTTQSELKQRSTGKFARRRRRQRSAATARHFYDVSLVDGYNIPIAMAPAPQPRVPRRALRPRREERHRVPQRVRGVRVAAVLLHGAVRRAAAVQAHVLLPAVQVGVPQGIRRPHLHPRRHVLRRHVLPAPPLRNHGGGVRWLVRTHAPPPFSNVPVPAFLFCFSIRMVW
jgi:hypothetical protein